MTRPIQTGKTYGVLNTEDYFLFIGFAKKVGSDEIQKIDVYLDDKLIDTIEANEFIQKIDDMYDVKSKAFTYNLPTQYIGTKAIISFKNHDSGEELLNSPYTLIDKNHESFNEAMFLHSLEGNFDNEKIQNINPKDSIGFLATEDNILNKDLIKLINTFLEQNLYTRFKVFYFNNEQKKLISEKFNKYQYKIDFIMPKDIYDIANNTSIYIHSSTANKKPKSFGYHKLWQVLNQTKANMFMINIFEEIDDKEYSKSLKLLDNCKIEFEKSVISKIFENDERYNEFKFVNNLNQNITQEKLQNTNPQDSIGFLATEDNILNKDFIKLINIFLEKNIDTRFKVFYFNNEQKKLISEKFNKYLSKFDFIIPKDIYDITNNTSIYIHSSTANEKPKSFGYWKTWRVLNQTKANMFLINIFEEIDDKEYSKSLKLIDNYKIGFEKSIVSKIFENNERYNEFRFINSINQPINDEIKNIYSPNSIGFLATKENLEDEEFVGYIKELMDRFPEVEFKEFNFNNTSNKTNSIEITTIYDITKNCCVLITNPQLINNRLDQIITQQQTKFQNIFISPLWKINMNKKVKDIVNTDIINTVKNNLEIFNLTENDIKEISHNHILMIRKVYEKLLEIDSIEKDILLDLDFVELQFMYINLALYKKEFIEVQKHINSILINLNK